MKCSKCNGDIPATEVYGNWYRCDQCDENFDVICSDNKCRSRDITHLSMGPAWECVKCGTLRCPNGHVWDGKDHLASLPRTPKS